MIKFVHVHSKGKVNVNGVLSSEFLLNSGALQENVLSPILFILLKDFVICRTVRDVKEGLDLIGDRNLADHNTTEFAMLSYRMYEISYGVGLKINRRKTEMMRKEYAGDAVLLTRTP
ncbi:uncharacterized protein [Palaemon carinicauda]|uniref:uncharacterized protein n=1 Tax=Palaemon carinicauda TaxID=392227 RepID=UPI0035B5F98A